MTDVYVQTSSVNILGPHPQASIDTHYGMEYLNPRPIVVSADALESKYCYNVFYS